MGASVRGSVVFLLVAFLGLALVAMIYETHQANQDTIVQHRAILDELQNQTYIQSLPIEQRPRLMMPRSLETRLERQHGWDDRRKR